MKKQNLFVGIVLIGFGAYFLLDYWHPAFLNAFKGWPTLLIMIGVAIFIQAFWAKDYGNLFPATLLLGLGIHFHFLHRVSWWPSGWAVYTFIFGLAFLVRYYKEKKDGLFIGITLVAISALNFFYKGFQDLTQYVFTTIGSFWPLLLVAAGLYLILKK
ncbi:LiaI-LiaF-like domain-containing protein [Camelliibacillus cellulosilyticus]|uniref:LiaI-LiaF-like domain-containing protein n=1 Tax=Camelliibacillus cellulosilyticus TaxID=2174486 RepID=A0ABV9GMK9_9BACL